MATTSYGKVFEKFLSLITDRYLSTNLTNEQLTEFLDLLLNEARNISFKGCLVDLTNVENPDFLSQTFTADGVHNTFTISDYPNNPNADSLTLSCKVNGSDATYSFDDITKTFTVTSALAVDDTVICSYEFIGQFNNEVSDEICWILAYSMVCVWYKHKLYNTNLMKNSLTSKDWNAFSGANLLEKLTELNNIAEKKIRQLVVNYSYNGFLGFL